MNSLTQKIILLSLFLAVAGHTLAQTAQRAQRNEQPQENTAQQNTATEQNQSAAQTQAQTQTQKQTQTSTEEQRQRDMYVYSPGIMLPKIDSSNLNAPPTPQPNPQRRENAKNWLIERYDYSGRKERAAIRSEQAVYLNQTCDAVIDRLKSKQIDSQEFQYLSTSLDQSRVLKTETEKSIAELSHFEAPEFQQLQQQEENTLKILDSLAIKIEQAIFLFF